MFAMLGDIKFDSVKNGITSYSHSMRARFATHEVFKKKQKLQKIAPSIDEIPFTFSLHQKSGNIEDRIDRLKEMVSKQNPVSFMFGNGKFIGMFVIESATIVTEVADDQGGLIVVDISIFLREFAGDVEAGGNNPAISENGLGTLGSITANIDNALGMVDDFFNDISALIDLGSSLLEMADAVVDLIGTLRGANDGVQVLKNMNELLLGGVSTGNAIAQNAEGWNETQKNSYGDFLSAATALLESFEHVEGLAQDSIKAEDILVIDEFEAVSQNIVSQSQALAHERMLVICELGLRNL